PTVTTASASPPEDHFIVIVVDNLNIRPFNRKRVFGQLRSFLRNNVAPDDLVMLATLNRNFKVREGFTRDTSLITRALIEIESEVTGGPGQDGDRADFFQSIKQADSVSSAMGRARMYALEYSNDARATLSGLDDLVSSLGGLEGRKALLYVSDGVPMVAGEDAFVAVGETFDDTSAITGAREFDLTRNFQQVATHANTNRVTFYTIDATGLRAPTATAAEHGRQGPSPAVEDRYQHNLQAPLRQLADITGGQAILNTNDVGPALERASQDFYSYYSLGYRPSHAGDGRYHDIKVKVNRKGLDVRHRQGYRDRSTAQRMIEGTESALLYGQAKNRLEVVLAAQPSIPDDDGRFIVPIDVRIPIGKITLVPSGDVHLGRLRIFVGVVDEEGRQSPIEGSPLLIEIPAADIAAAREQSWIHDVRLMMRPGAQRVTVGVLDELAGVQSYTSGVIQVP
ncbi:MAG: VWA domain-containing protein, partial [Thermoanaerobaculia bacterium]|nr:VWA domain-containing protein [Thermoanaerobaculia bacterium]